MKKEKFPSNFNAILTKKLNKSRETIRSNRRVFCSRPLEINQVDLFHVRQDVGFPPLFLTSARKPGMTLIEIVFVMSIMTFLFIVGWAISNSFQSIKRVRNYEVAISLANQAIEAARAARFREIGADKDGRKDTLLADFLSSNNIFDGEKCEGFVPVLNVGGVEYKREISVVDAPSKIDGFPSELKLFRVLVKWKALEDGTPLTFEAVTTISNQW